MKLVTLACFLVLSLAVPVQPASLPDNAATCEVHLIPYYITAPGKAGHYYALYRFDTRGLLIRSLSIERDSLQKHYRDQLPASDRLNGPVRAFQVIAGCSYKDLRVDDSPGPWFEERKAHP